MKDKPENTSENPVTETKSTEPATTPKPPKKKIKKGFFARLRRESKRDRQLAALSDGYQQLVGLMSSIQMNMEAQAKNQQQLLGALEDLPEVADGLKRIGRAAEQQTEVIEVMRDQFNSNIHREKQMSKNVSRISKTLIVMNLLFLIAIAVAVYIFIIGLTEPLAPAENLQPAATAVETPDSDAPGGQPVLPAAATNVPDTGGSATDSNEVYETQSGTNGVETRTNNTPIRADKTDSGSAAAPVLTNAAAVSTNHMDSGASASPVLTNATAVSTNPPVSD